MKNEDTTDLKKILDVCPFGIAHCRIRLMEDGTHYDLKFDELNQSFAEILGLPEETILEKTAMELLSGSSENQILKKIIDPEILATEQEQTYLEHIPTQNRWYKIMFKPVAPGAATIFVSDVTMEKSAQTISESEERFRLLVELAPDIIFVQTEGKFTYVNQATAQLLGAASESDLIGESVLSIIHPDYQEIVRERMVQVNEKRQSIPPFDVVYIGLDGSLHDVESKAVPIRYQGIDGALVYVRSSTERRKAERIREKKVEAIRHSQRMEAIGLLASGVAHEINNPIMGIINYAQLILDGGIESAERNEYASEIIAESQRVAAIVNNLLTFARRGRQTCSLARMEDIIGAAVAIVKAVYIKDNITIETDIPDGLPLLRCRSEQIQQVLTNLLSNARDALNEKYAGFHEDKVIRVSGSQFFREQESWIRFTVEDRGDGIPEPIQQYLFDPFFSTKERPKGTGLGLPISYGIAEDHHGVLRFETEPGHYTRFHLELPVEQKPESNQLDSE